MLLGRGSPDIVALAFPQDMRKTRHHYHLLCPSVLDACRQPPKQAVRAPGQLYASCTSKLSSACVKLSRGVACAPTQRSCQTWPLLVLCAVFAAQPDACGPSMTARSVVLRCSRSTMANTKVGTASSVWVPAQAAARAPYQCA